jgi:hypothetical protein
MEIRNWNEILGRFGETTVNDTGDKVINICKQHDLKICNAFFEHKNIHRYIWEEPSLELLLYTIL